MTTRNPREDTLRRTYKEWHWGIPSTKKVTWSDPDYPDYLIEIGKLAELHIKRSPNAPKEIVNVAREFIDRSHVAFDPYHPGQRIYIHTPPEVRREALRSFWHPKGKRYALDVLAQMAGGRHDRDDYPPIEVQPIGYLSDVTYFTWKKGDDDDKGGSFYIHKLGEESKIRPLLAIDARGRFWLAGGNYTCPNPGITD